MIFMKPSELTPHPISQNIYGEYTVLSINGDKMRVAYSTGDINTLSISIQSRIIANRHQSQEITTINNYHKLKGSYKSYWTLGFLSVRLKNLYYRLMYDKQAQAEDIYQNITGQSLHNVMSFVYCYPEGANQWGNQGVIVFHAKPHELPLLNFKSTPSLIPNSLDIYQVSDIRYFYFMLENGFRLVDVQDLVFINNSIPKEYKIAFNSGNNSAKVFYAKG